MNKIKIKIPKVHVAKVFEQVWSDCFVVALPYIHVCV